MEGIDAAGILGDRIYCFRPTLRGFQNRGDGYCVGKFHTTLFEENEQLYKKPGPLSMVLYFAGYIRHQDVEADHLDQSYGSNKIQSGGIQGLIFFTKNFNKAHMKKHMNYYYAFSLLVMTSLTLGSCQVIGDIFKAGVWVGVLLVILVVGIILWLVGKARK